MRKRVFISGPLAGGDRIANLAQALHAMQVLLKGGYAPLCPHLTMLADFLFAGSVSYEDYLEQCLAWVEVSDAILRLPGASPGGDRECAHAINKGVPLFVTLGRLFEQLPAI